MIVLKWFLMAAGAAMFGSTASVVAYDVYLAMQFQRLMGLGERGTAEEARARRPLQSPLGRPLAAKSCTGDRAPLPLGD